MEIPCKECLVFPCCKNRAVNGIYLHVHSLLNCKIFYEWAGDWYITGTKKEMMLKYFISDVLVYGGK